MTMHLTTSLYAFLDCDILYTCFSNNVCKLEAAYIMVKLGPRFPLVGTTYLTPPTPTSLTKHPNK